MDTYMLPWMQLVVANCWLLTGWISSISQVAAAETDLQPDAVYAVPTSRDQAGRVLAPVTVNGRGPYRFILDTGANRAVISPRLVEELQLQLTTDGPAVSVHGVTGTAILPAIRITELRTGDLVLARDRNMPVLSEAVLANADGILGIEGLGSARIDIDFVDDQVTIASSTGWQRAPPGYLTIRASLHHKGLIVIPGRVGRIRVKAIIDTGAERTLGNNALREALLLAAKNPSGEMTTSVFGATPDVGLGTSLVAPTVFLGPVKLRNLVVIFGDLHVFRLWDLEAEPALLIGMDLLGTVDRLVIDYTRREIQIKPRSRQGA